MIQNIVVEVAERTDRGKGPAGRLRRTGKIPAVLYGMGLPPYAVSVSRRRMEEILKLESGRNTIFTLALEGQDKSRAAMIRVLQRDPVTENLVHVDFVRVDLTKKVRVDVPVRLHGVPEGVKNQGGLLEFILREVAVECLPSDIPEHIDVDVSALNLHESITVADLPTSDRFTYEDEPEETVCQVATPRVEEEPAPAEEEVPVEGAAEPEVIKKGKEASEEGASEE